MMESINRWANSLEITFPVIDRLSTHWEMQLKMEIDQHWLKKLPVCDSWTSYCYLLRSQHYHTGSIRVHTVSYTFWGHKPPLTTFFFFPVYMLQISQNQPGLFGPSRSCLTTHVVCKPERLQNSRLPDRKVWKSDPRTSKVMWCGRGVSKLANNILLRLRKWKSFPALIVQKRSDLAVHVLSLHYI